MAFELPTLPYAYDALEPHIDARTMEIHHGKHHAGYTSKLNAAIEGTEMEGKDIEALLADHSDNGAVRNNGGGYYNHTLFGASCHPMAAERLRAIWRQPLIPTSVVGMHSSRPLPMQRPPDSVQDGRGSA